MRQSSLTTLILCQDQNVCFYLFYCRYFLFSASAPPHPHGAYLDQRLVNPLRLQTAEPPPPFKASILMGQTCANCAKVGTDMFFFINLLNFIFESMRERKISEHILTKIKLNLCISLKVIKLQI